MTLALGFQGGVLGFGAEEAFGTKVTPSKFVAITSDGITVEEERLHSEAIPQIFTDDDEVAKGGVKVSGEVGFELRYEGAELLFKHAMGSVATVETASFIVGASNKTIDFNIGAAELTATVAEGTYAAGSTQATLGSLCKAIYDAIVAAEATGTYTVSFSTATKLFTITRSAGTFQLLWNTGTNKATSIAALIGYAATADDTGAITYTGDTAVVPVFTHTFTLADALPAGITLEIDRDASAFSVEGGKINTLTISAEYGKFATVNIGIIGEDITAGTATSATLSASPLVVFSHGVINYGGSPVSCKSASLTLNNNLKSDRYFIGSRLISEPQRAGKVEVTGTVVIEFSGVNEYNDFRAATSRALTLVFTHDVAAGIKTGQTYVMTITVPVIKLTGGMPLIKDEGIIELELPFKAYATSTSAREFNITIKNTVVSV